MPHLGDPLEKTVERRHQADPGDRENREAGQRLVRIVRQQDDRDDAEYPDQHDDLGRGPNGLVEELPVAGEFRLPARYRVEVFEEMVLAPEDANFLERLQGFAEIFLPLPGETERLLAPAFEMRIECEELQPEQQPDHDRHDDGRERLDEEQRGRDSDDDDTLGDDVDQAERDLLVNLGRNIANVAHQFRRIAIRQRQVRRPEIKLLQVAGQFDRAVARETFLQQMAIGDENVLEYEHAEHAGAEGEDEMPLLLEAEKNINRLHDRRVVDEIRIVQQADQREYHEDSDDFERRRNRRHQAQADEFQLAPRSEDVKEFSVQLEQAVTRIGCGHCRVDTILRSSLTRLRISP